MLEDEVKKILKMSLRGTKQPRSYASSPGIATRLPRYRSQ